MAEQNEKSEISTTKIASENVNHLLLANYYDLESFYDEYLTYSNFQSFRNSISKSSESTTEDEKEGEKGKIYSENAKKNKLKKASKKNFNKKHYTIKLNKNLYQLDSNDKSQNVNYDLINFLNYHPEKEVLLNEITNHEISSLAPKINIYKKDLKNNSLLCPFETHTNLKDLSLMTSDSKSRGSGIGFKSFKIKNQGKSQTEVYLSFIGELNLYISSVDDLYKIRNEKTFEDGESLNFTILDLLRPSLTNDEFFEIEVGWYYDTLINTLKDSNNTQRSQDIIKALKDINYTFSFEYLAHTMSTNSNGEIDLKIDIVLNTDAIFSAKTKLNSFYLYKIYTNKFENYLENLSKLKKDYFKEKSRLKKNFKSIKTKEKNIDNKALLTKAHLNLTTEKREEYIKKLDSFKEMLLKEFILTSLSMNFKGETNFDEKDIRFFILRGVFIDDKAILEKKNMTDIKEDGSEEEIDIKVITPDIIQIPGINLNEDYISSLKDSYKEETESFRLQDFTYFGNIVNNFFNPKQLSKNYEKSNQKIKNLIDKFSNVILLLGGIEFRDEYFKLSHIPISISSIYSFLNETFYRSSNYTIEMSIKEYILKIINKIIIPTFVNYYDVEKIKLLTRVTLIQDLNDSKIKKLKEIGIKNINKDSKIFYIFVEEHNSLLKFSKALTSEDKKNKNIYTIYSHKQEGIIKDIENSEIKNSHFAEANMIRTTQNFNMFPQFYSTKLTLLGNNIFTPGNYFYLNNLYTHQNKITLEKEEKGNDHAFNFIFLDGYYQVTGLDLEFNGDTAKYTSSIYARWAGDDNLNKKEKGKNKTKKLTLEERKLIEVNNSKKSVAELKFSAKYKDMTDNTILEQKNNNSKNYLEHNDLSINNLKIKLNTKLSKIEEAIAILIEKTVYKADEKDKKLTNEVKAKLKAKYFTKINQLQKEKEKILEELKNINNFKNNKK